jgi:signal peptidase II
LTLVKNTGIAFGFFHGHEKLLFVLITLSLVILIAIAHRMAMAHSQPAAENLAGPPFLAHWGLALILGGAFGNWIDRIRFKAVIDFIDLRVWPVFNLADTAITIGVILYLILLVKKT